MRETEVRANNSILKFFINSFRYSQGDAAVQTYIFEFARRNHFLESSMPIDYKALENTSRDVIKTLFSEGFKTGHEVTSDRNVETAVKSEIGQLQSVMQEDAMIGGELSNRFSAIDDSRLLLTLARFLVQQESRFLLRSVNGRSNRKLQPDGTPILNDYLSDPFFSYIVFHALKGNSTSQEVYDHLFRQVGDYYRTVLQSEPDSDFGQTLLMLIDKYNETHPEEKFVLTEINSEPNIADK